MNKNQPITQADATTLIKHMARDFDIVSPRLTFHAENNHTCADYSGFEGENRKQEIRIFGDTTIGTVVHEFCHHLQFSREGKTNHKVNFHRICFEVRDYLLSVYDMAVHDINHYTTTASYLKALDEWFSRLQAAKLPVA